MRYLLTLLVAFCLSGSLLTAQTSELVEDLVKDAITAMESGHYDVAFKLLDSAETLAPEWEVIPYERGLAYYLQKDYAAAVKVFEQLREHPRVTDRVYSMLGNCYDMLGDRDKARTTYESGLERFPDSGPLYLERGVIDLAEPSLSSSVNWFERGVQAAPYHPSCYYWLAKFYLETVDHRTWGLLYGELFCILEPDTKRTREIGAAMVKAWNDAIPEPKGDSMHFELGGSEIDISQLISIDGKDTTVTIPFDLFAYRGTMAAAFGIAITNRTERGLPWRGVNDTLLTETRKIFLEQWSTSKFDAKYNVPLFKMQASLAASGHLQTYHHWLLSRGDPEPFAEWCNSNRDACTAMFKSIRQSMPNLEEEPRFCRRNIEKR